MTTEPLLYNVGTRLPGQTNILREMVVRDGVKTMALWPREQAEAYLDTLPDQTEKFMSVLGYGNADLETAPLSGPFYLDIDAPNLDDALQAARKAYRVLAKPLPADIIAVYFSGGKGFHIEIDQQCTGVPNSADLHLFYKYLASSLSQQVGIPCLDLGIYDRARLWRVEGSWNPKTQAYKTRLPEEVFKDGSLENILEYSRQPHPISEALVGAADADPATVGDIRDDGAREFFRRAYEAFLVARQRDVSATYDAGQIKPLPPSATVPCIDALMAARLTAGEGRNRALWVLAAFYRSQGWPETDILDAVGRVNQQFVPPLARTEFNAVLKHVMTHEYKVGCHTPELSERCDRQGCYYFRTPLPPPEQVAATSGLQIEEFPNGFSCRCGDYAYAVTDVRATPQRTTAKVKMTGPNGLTRFGQIDVMSDLSKRRYVTGLPTAVRQQVLDGLSQIAEYTNAIATKQRNSGEGEAKSVHVEDGRYVVTKLTATGGVEDIPITNFTVSVDRVVYEMEPDGEVNAVRELIFHGSDGAKSRPRRAAKGDLSSKTRFAELCLGCGDFTFTGSDRDLSLMVQEYIFGAAARDEAVALDHIGRITVRDVGRLFLWGNVGVHDGAIIYPDDEGVFRIDDTNYQVRGLDLREQWESGDTMPRACTEYLENPDGLRELKRSVLDLLRSSLTDYRGWLALGVVYAGFYTPEIVKRYRAFPGLSLFGVMGSGKNTLMRWLLGAVGMSDRCAINFPNTSVAAMDRWAAYYSGLPVALDEFRNLEKQDHKIHLLRNWYDKQGRSISYMGNTSVTINRPVRGWTLIAGQDRSMDAAFNSRFVNVTMMRNRSSDQDLKLKIDDLMRTTSSAIALDVMRKVDDHSTAKFYERVDVLQKRFMGKLSGPGFERMALNYAIAVTGWSAAFGTAVEQSEVDGFLQWLESRMLSSNLTQTAESEAMGFLNDVVNMAVAGILEEGRHYKFVNDREFIDKEKRFYAEQALLLWIPMIHTAWSEWKGRTRTGAAFTRDAITHALENEPFFISPRVEAELDGRRAYCVALNAHGLPDDILYGLRRGSGS